MSHWANADLCLLQINAHRYSEGGDDLQDSNKLIPPPTHASAPASVVPFAQAPSSMRVVLSKQSAHSMHGMPTQGGGLGRASSRDASFRSQGSGYSSEPAREGDAQPETLPHMFSKDWELNLDALEVSYHYTPRGYPLCSPWPPPMAGA